ncbi:RNA methyltransferase [Vibrio vulnificus]|uniref:TrmH family RNA methyltransferase n=1 Tax=Vibrio vulnificus TaxID=672 RepID=UPI00102A52E2|nr:RNA methyltransferase [Vibrio vulnificus]EGQ7990767.1 RNA methyltransferase [Vibrio vulnificus]EGR0088762.1 RNA methyltransferase [Vibrio vulnificus]EGR0106661.1 RNA methyltransferase [Vibrio vulnificus]EGR7944007.1 RNA methyltransferase [Vibrio vulnificus]EHU9451626.1 RNA methyltransferase [Vibrio vulnificus]
MEASKKQNRSVRRRAKQIKGFRCKNLIAVIEAPDDIKNIGTVIRNVNAFGAEKVYVIDPRNALPAEWQDMRDLKALSKTSVSAVKWSFVKRFDSTSDCIAHLEKNRFVSMVTSPHVKGKENATLDKVDFTVDYKLALWFGNERLGVSKQAIAHSKLCVSIPMFGMIESLNLGTTSGIVMYEATKQRRDYQSKYLKRNKRVLKVDAHR